LVDEVGVYYDASTPSTIENILNQDDSDFDKQCSKSELAYANECRTLLVDNDICKYNYCQTRIPSVPRKNTSESPSPLDPASNYILVVDQTLDDASVKFGGMDESSFRRMLDAAIDENPNTPVYVRSHPDVVSGRRKGYLSDYAKTLNVPVIAGFDNPMPWVKNAKRVYVGTSQLGYEALLCDCAVTVFGLPFYAGWGLADERQEITRRVQRRSIDQLFYASHVRLAKYCSPMSGEEWQLHEMLAHIQLQKDNFKRNSQRFHCVGITPWKRRYVQQFLRSPDGSVTFGEPDDTGDADTLVTWGFRRFSDKKDEAQLPVWRLEDGFLRSAGLGSGSADKLCVLVTGQVEDDESIKRGCAKVTTNAELLRAVRKIRPDAWIVYRPHPDVQAGNRKGAVDPFTEQSCADVVDTESSIITCIEACDELHTMTSLSGFEALLRDKKVVTYGSPFYAGWGLTEDHAITERRCRRRTLDELIYLALVKYPRYVDIESGEFVSAEQMVSAIQRQKEQSLNNNENSWRGRQVSKVVNIVKGLRYAP